MKSRVGSVFAILFATIFAATNALGHSGMWGSGMHGGLQSCPFPYGVPSGAFSYLDEISDRNKETRQYQKDKNGFDETKRKAQKEMHDAEREIKKAFKEPFAEAIIEHLKSENSCADYDPTDRGHKTILETECDRLRGPRPETAPSDSEGPAASLPLAPKEDDRYYPQDTENNWLRSTAPNDKGDKSTPAPSLLDKAVESVRNLFNLKKNESEYSQERLPAEARGYTDQQKTQICNAPRPPKNLFPRQWGRICSGGGPGEIPAEACKISAIIKDKDIDCADALKEFRENYLEHKAASKNSDDLKKLISANEKAVRKLSKKVDKEVEDAQTEAQHCPWCQYYESQKTYENMSTPGKIGHWIGALSPLLLAGAAGASSYFLGKEYMSNASKLGYLTGPTPSPMAFGFPYMLAGLYGSVSAAVNGGFGCYGGAWGPAGMYGPYGNGGLYGGMGGAFGIPPWMMGMPMGGGAFMPGFGPWGMASPFGMMPFGGMGLVGGLGLAMGGFPMGGMGGVFPGFPMGGFAGVGGLGLAMGGFPMGGMGFPMAGMGFPMGGMGFAIGGMGGLGLVMGGFPMGGMGFPMGGFGFPMGGMAITGMAGFAMPGMGFAMPGMGYAMGGFAMAGGMDMGMTMQFQMMQQQMQMQQYQMMMQVQAQMQQRQMARYQVMAGLSQEMMALQMRIQQVSMGFDVGFGGGYGYGGMPFPGPYSGGPFPPPYTPPYLRPGVAFPGGGFNGSFNFFGLGR